MYEKHRNPKGMEKNKRIKSNLLRAKVSAETEEIMYQIIKEGYTIRIKLPAKYGQEGYSVKCTYKYKKAKEKYMLALWLKRDDIEENFRIDAQEIDAQLIPGTRETIENNILRIVRQANETGYFDRYIKRFEYTCKCFEKGNELIEQERLAEKENAWENGQEMEAADHQ